MDVPAAGNTLGDHVTAEAPRRQTPLRVGVVIPAFDAGAWLSTTLASVRGQSLPPDEVVIVDDGSRDDTLRLAQREAAREERWSVVDQPNRGVAAARNAGFAALGTDLEAVMFLDADDQLLPRALERLATACRAVPEAAAAYCSMHLVDDRGAALGDGPADYWRPRLRRSRLGVRRIPDADPRTPFLAIWAGAAVIPSVTLIRAPMFRAAGGFDPDFGQPFEDMDLFLRLAENRPFAYVPERLVLYRRHAEQSTAKADVVHAQQQKLEDRWRAARAEGASEASESMRALNRWVTPRDAPGAVARAVTRGDPRAAVTIAGGAVRRILRP